MNKKFVCSGVIAAMAFLPLFATDVENSPATQRGSSSEKSMSNEEISNSPLMKSQQKSGSNKFPSEHHKNAYDSLSTKNKKVYDTLEKGDQDKVADTHKKGGNTQKTLSDILSKDQKGHTKSGSSDDKFFWDKKKDKKSTPATRAMNKKAKQKDSDGIFD